MDDPVERLACARREFSESGGVNPGIDPSTTFTVLNPADLKKIFSGERGPERGGCYLYSRSFSPTVRVLSRALAALEGTQAAYATASGMAAISSALLALCDHGDRIVCSSAVYGGTHALLKSFLPQKCGIASTFVDISDLAAVEAAVAGGGGKNSGIGSNGVIGSKNGIGIGNGSSSGDGTPAATQPAAKVLFCETVANPTLVVADLPALARIAHRHGAALVVDNTFAPLAVSPARHGADVVVHSCTKTISGQSDMLAGAVCGSRDFVARLMDLHTGPVMLLGPTLDPRLAAELAARLAHLPLRVREHARRARELAARLEREFGARVTYPGLPSHPGHALYARLANREEGDREGKGEAGGEGEGGEGGGGEGARRAEEEPAYGYGGIFGLEMPGGAAQAEALMQRLQNKHAFGLVAVSLGFSETLMSLSASSTSSELSAEERARARIGDGYVRVSVGLTGTLEQRWRQLREAYAFVTRHWAPSCSAGEEEGDGAVAGAADAAGAAAAAAAAAAADAAVAPPKPHAAAGVAVPYLATRVLRDRAGIETDVEQWPSSGSELELEGEEEEEEEGDGAAAAAAAKDARRLLERVGGGGGGLCGPAVPAAAHAAGSLSKERRIASNVLIRYTPLA